MKKFYGTDLCSGCREAKKIIQRDNIEVEFIDITGSIENLKAFLFLRDTRKEFDEAKKEHRVGIPCFIEEDGSISFTI